MTYIDLIGNDQFNKLLDKYINSRNKNTDYKEYFNHFKENLKNNEIIVPILGIQGSGKSSFLNALLMTENILPTDVDETTCVPVEIRYGTTVNEAKIFYINGNEEIINIKDLEEYVHNDNNKGNSLKIKKIVVYNTSDILKNNLVLVDLPGVGSLTPENQKTTLDYINRLVCAIFIIRTNPPITRTEKNFINALWPKLSNTVFIQNKWNDEYIEDANEAKEHNEGVLSSISIAHKDNREIKVNIVNIYEAIKGKFTDDYSLYDESGIVAAIDEIKKIPVEYNKILTNSLNQKIKDIIENINNIIEEYKAAALNEKIENQVEKERKINEIKDLLLENRKKFRNIKSYAYDEMENAIDYSLEAINENMDKLRREIKRIINKGIVDGERLGLIYKEMSDKAINNIMDMVLDRTSEVIKNLNSKLEYIKIKNFNGNYENISSFNKKSEFKFEKSLPSVLGISGGVAGTISAIGTLGGPAGILIGMGVGLAFTIIGDSIRKKIVKTRADYTMKDLEPMIENLEIYLKEEILDDLKAKQQDVDNIIKELKDKLEIIFKEDIEGVENQYEAVYSKEHLAEFETDLKILNQLKSSLKM